jgi:DNA-binding LacI/PurR family transcriptional regulator
MFRPLGLTGKTLERAGRLRVGSLRKSLEEVGEQADPRLVVSVERADDCRREVSRLIHDADPPTVFVASTGEITAPILLAVGDAGLSVPGDVSGARV